MYVEVKDIKITDTDDDVCPDSRTRRGSITCARTHETPRTYETDLDRPII